MARVLSRAICRVQVSHVGGAEELFVLQRHLFQLVEPCGSMTYVRLKIHVVLIEVDKLLSIDLTQTTKHLLW